MIGIFLDLECSGLNPMVHRSLECAFQIVCLDSGKELARYHTMILQSDKVWEQMDPESIRVNGLSKEKTSSGKSEEEVGKDIIKIFTDLNIVRGKAVFICQNPSFDRNFFNQLVPIPTQENLLWPYHWLDFASMYWGIQVGIHKTTPKSLSKDRIAEEMGLPEEKCPHQAMNGVQHLLDCYKAVIGFPKS